MEQKIEKILSELKSLEEDLINVKQMVTETEDKVDPLCQRVEDLEARHGTMYSEMETLRGENREFRNHINSLEQYSWKPNLVIDGIPVQKDENWRSVVQAIAPKLEVSLPVAVHRLPSENKNLSPIIMKFVKYDSIGRWIKLSEKEKAALQCTEPPINYPYIL